MRSEGLYNRPYSFKMTLGIFAAMATVVPCMPDVAVS